MKRLSVLVLACSVIFSAAAGSASEKWKDLKFLTTDEVKAMLDGGEDFLLINALSPIEFYEQRIPGSVNFPYGSLVTGKKPLPEDKAKKLVFYCKGPKCTKSKKSAAYAVEQGYTSVFVYDGGLPEWAKSGHDMESDGKLPDANVPALAAADLKAMIDKGDDLVLLDIRDEVDRSAGWIKGSLHIPMDELQARFEEIPTGKKTVVMCLHGKQSGLAGRFLASKGFTDLSKLDGGVVSGWMKAALPFEK